MNTKEALEKAIKDVRKEWEWILLESRWIQRLKYAVKVGDYSQIRRFERKAARSERRVNRFEERVIEILNFLRQKFPTWNTTLSDIEEKTKIFNKNILKRVSLIDGTIPNLIKQNNYGQINTEIDNVMNEGVRPLDILLSHLEKELKKALEKNVIAEKIKEEELPAKLEDSLKRQPFLIVFHSANEKAFAHNILMMGRGGLPDFYMGRRLEYALEVDYFWIEHHGRLSTFFGHTTPVTIPRKAEKILEMYRGKTNPTQLKHRLGLMFPEWLLSRIGRIKLGIEIKGGRGSDEKALDYLVKLIKSYHLENNITFFGFSAWPLEYLKKRLPNSFIVHMTFYGSPLLGRNLPLNKFLKSFKCKYSIQSLTGGWKVTTHISNICILRNPTERTK